MKFILAAILFFSVKVNAQIFIDPHTSLTNNNYGAGLNVRTLFAPYNYNDFKQNGEIIIYEDYYFDKIKYLNLGAEMSFIIPVNQRNFFAPTLGFGYTQEPELTFGLRFVSKRWFTEYRHNEQGNYLYAGITIKISTTQGY